MNYIRRADERGQSRLDWLTSRHSFSFGSYVDPAHMGFSALRVINDDVVAAGAGFDAHGHRDMEIISYVLEGALRHEDSTGTVRRVQAGEIQLMSAGAGIVHSEYNDSSEAPVRFLQIWIQPTRHGTAPGYVQRNVPVAAGLVPLVTPDGRGGTLQIGQQATLSRLQLSAGEALTLPITADKGYLHVIDGVAEVGALVLYPGDAVGLVAAEGTQVRARQAVHALYFELPPE